MIAGKMRISISGPLAFVRVDARIDIAISSERSRRRTDRSTARRSGGRGPAVRSMREGAGPST